MKKINNLISLLQKLGFNYESSLIKFAASKKRQLIKFGLSEELAEKIDNACGGLSMWAYNLMLKDIFASPDAKLKDKLINEIEDQDAKKIAAIEYLEKNYDRKYSESIVEIMDWLKLGLEGDFAPHKNKTIAELISIANDWKSSLGTMTEINYIENNKIILDFRDENGFGYYWVDLNKSYSKQESHRMGHCGTCTGKHSVIISLRRYSPHETRPNTTINESIISACLNREGVIGQMKGRHNEKPDSSLEKYILALYTSKYSNKEAFGKSGLDDLNDGTIKGYEWEYISDEDFKIEDFSDESLKELYEKNPSMFSFTDAIILSERIRGLDKHPCISEKKSFKVSAEDIYRTFDMRISRFNDFREKTFLSMINGEDYDNYDPDIISFLELFDNDLINQNSEISRATIKYLNENILTPENHIADTDEIKLFGRDFNIIKNLDMIASQAYSDALVDKNRRNLLRELIYNFPGNLTFANGEFSANLSIKDLLEILSEDKIDVAKQYAESHSDNSCDPEEFFYFLLEEGLIKRDVIYVRDEDYPDMKEIREYVIASLSDGNVLY